MSTLKGSKQSAGSKASGSTKGVGKVVSYADNDDDDEDSYFTTVKGSGDKVC